MPFYSFPICMAFISFVVSVISSSLNVRVIYHEKILRSIQFRLESRYEIPKFFVVNIGGDEISIFI